MTQQFNTAPTYDEPLTIKGQIARGWFRLWTGLQKGQPTGPTAAVLVGASPFKFVAAQGGTLIVNGGSTTQISFSRDGNNFFITGLTAGMFPVSQGDTVQITYPVAPPTITFVPR